MSLVVKKVVSMDVPKVVDSAVEMVVVKGVYWDDFLVFVWVVVKVVMMDVVMVPLWV